MEELRTFHDRLTAAVPDADLVAEIVDDVRNLGKQLKHVETDESSQICGRLPSPGRGQALVPPVRVVELTPGSFRGLVRFGRYYLGGNGAVHGGAIPLLFDDILGHFANVGVRRAARTASLHVDYKVPTPVGVELEISARIACQEGRKHFLHASISAGDVVHATAEGLFIELRKGQL